MNHPIIPIASARQIISPMMQVKSFSRPKKSVGNIETFLKRNYGRIHDVLNDNIQNDNNHVTPSILRINEAKKRPISALRSFKVQKDKLSLDHVSISQRLRYQPMLMIDI